MLEKLGKFLQGKKTYIVAGIGGVVVILQLLGVPLGDATWTILGLLGLGSLRSAISKIEVK